MDLDKLKNNQAKVIEKLQDIILEDRASREQTPSIVDAIATATETLFLLDEQTSKTIDGKVIHEEQF